MGKHRDLEERLAQAEQLHERNLRSAQRHRKAGDKFKDQRRPVPTIESRRLQQRAEALAKKWHKEVRRLQKAIRVRDALVARAPTRVSPTAVQPPSKKLLKHTADRRKALAAAGLEADPRTAHGRRPYDVVSLGGRNRASLSHFHVCFRSKADRSPTRVLAWSAVDEHAHRLHAGLYPASRFEPGVDVSSIPGVSDSRLDAARCDAELRAELGRDLHHILISVVYFGQGFDDLSDATGLSDSLIRGFFTLALDRAAEFFRIADMEKGRDRRRHVWNAQTPAEVSLEG